MRKQIQRIITKTEITCPCSGNKEAALKQTQLRELQMTLPPTFSITCDKANYCNYGKCPYQPEI